MSVHSLYARIERLENLFAQCDRMYLEAKATGDADLIALTESRFHMVIDRWADKLISYSNQLEAMAA